MGFLSGGNQQTQPPVYGSIQVQTASSALPIPIVWGVQKVAPNIIWNGGFFGVPVGKSSNGKAGKGGAFGKQNNPQDYYCAIVLALCEGPVGGISAVWDNSTITGFGGEGPDGTTSMPSPNFINGEIGQAPWNLLSESYSGQALGYSGVALVADYQIALGEAATLDSYNFEVIGVFQGSGFNGYDADPALVVQDFLTNEQYGVGFASSSIDTSTLIGSSGDSSFQSYCKAAGLALSPLLSDQETASSILARWLQLTNTAAVWSGGQLKFIPYGDTPLSGPLYRIGGDGHLVSFGTSNTSQSYAYADGPQIEIGTCAFNPDVAPIYNLTDDDFVAADNDDPVQVQRTDPYEAYNYQSLEISQRNNFYDATEIDVWDQNAIDTYGLRKASTVTAHEICDAAIAQNSAQLILQRGLYIRNHYTFKLSWEYCLLEPMDIVTITDEILGLDNTAVRITDVSEDDDGILSITAEEFPNGVASAVEYPVQAPSGAGIAGNAPAPSVSEPVIFEPPYALAGDLEVWIAVCAPSGESYGGCNVYLSTDGESYAKIGQILGSAIMGKTTSALPSIVGASGSAVLDQTDTLAVDLTESDGGLSPVSNSAMLAGASACFVGPSADGEIIAYQNAALTSANNYALSPLLRGVFGSEIVSHPAGSDFAVLSSSLFRQSFNPNQIGQQLYFKFQSFNTLGGGQQGIDDCEAYPYTITGQGLAGPVASPPNLRIAFDGQAPQLSWDTIEDDRGTPTYVILVGVNAASAQVVGSTKLPPFKITTPGTYWVVAQITPIPNLVLSSPPSSSVTLEQNMLVENLLVSIDEQAENWPGALVNLKASGASPDEILLLGPAVSLDYGVVSNGLVDEADDFGIVSVGLLIGEIDLGIVSDG